MTHHASSLVPSPATPEALGNVDRLCIQCGGRVLLNQFKAWWAWKLRGAVQGELPVSADPPATTYARANEPLVPSDEDEDDSDGSMEDVEEELGDQDASDSDYEMEV